MKSSTSHPDGSAGKGMPAVPLATAGAGVLPSFQLPRRPNPSTSRQLRDEIQHRSCREVRAPEGGFRVHTPALGQPLDGRWAP